MRTKPRTNTSNLRRTGRTRRRTGRFRADIPLGPEDDNRIQANYRFFLGRKSGRADPAGLGVQRLQLSILPSNWARTIRS